jgi:NAD(P)-dependent dehydrogenase (short-subunit alcohol dehydrogenase family)
MGDGRVAVVTGATSGIGYICARDLVGQGYEVHLAFRDPSRGEASAQQIREAHPGGAVHPFRIDLASLASVREASAELLDRCPRIDVLVNNAGGFQGSRWVTDDGFEATFAVNHLGPYLLTRLLLDRLREHDAPRVVFTSSDGHRFGPLDLDDLQLEHGWSGIKAYGASKLMNLLTAQALHARWGDDGLVASSMHPGGVRTGIWRKGGWLASVIGVLGYPFMRSPERGADTLTWLASSPEAAAAAGRYFVDRKPVEPAHTSPEVRDALWARSAALVGLDA